ncbi:hypothetical protein KPL78_25855 [Roseomonas sp. HJA6]|uniref:SDR family NAD(P)-dependent oxidoreductase n=1 Tax=Roseomonas alba TaxID=2846776 RepID=A0ABS7AG82_9PROT|nr:hypothetical protein [Neoroseomonas alba]MBW6401309.1 hypothetical protein [Neoroseomonas alba]
MWRPPAGTKEVAAQANVLGRFDAVIHNAVGYREALRVTTDGLPHVFAINTPPAYILTALMEWPKRRWYGSAVYAESKLHDAMLASAVARRWPEVVSSALEPGWVPTRMGGPGAPDDMDQAHHAQA